MKLNIRAEGLFKKQNIEENEEEVVETDQSYHLPATRYNISNEEESTDALEDSTKQILLKIQDLEGTKSNTTSIKATTNDDVNDYDDLINVIN